MIVTENPSHFPDHCLAPYKPIAQGPDTFIADNSIKTHGDRVLSVICKHRKASINPPLSSDQHLKVLRERRLVKTVSLLQPHQVPFISCRQLQDMKWRTAPLWGLGLTHRVNGRAGFSPQWAARSVDERPSADMGAKLKVPRRNDLALAPKDRQVLLDWLQGL